MFEFLASLLSAPPPQREEIAPGVALAALMVEAARADDDYAETERDMIDAVLVALFDLECGAAAALRAQGEDAQRDAPDLVRFTRVLKAAYPFEQRDRLIEALWRVALADGHRAPEEDALIRRLAPLLGVSDQHSAAARRRALGEAG